MDYVDQLYSQLFASNQDLNKYKPIAEQALTELFDDNRVKFEVSVTELRHLVQKQSDIRGEELVIFRRCVDEIKSDVDKECLRRIHLFYHDKKKVSCAMSW